MHSVNDTKTFQIGNRTVGPGQPCYLICEVGTTCLGDLDMALKLVEAGAAAGMDSIKFQVIDADQLSDRSVTYPIRHGDAVEHANMYEMMAKLSFSVDQWREIADACKRHNVQFFATVDYVSGVDMLEQVGVPAYKLSAWDCTFRPLIERMGQTGKPMLVDLGPTSEKEIDDILEWYYSAGGNAAVLLHDFHTGEDREMNMAAIHYLAGHQPWPVGFSSPALDHDLDFLALGMGVHLLEKRLILDRSMRAFHAHESLTPAELKDWVDRVRHLERSMGEPAVKPSTRDLDESKKHYRSICTTKPVKAGEQFTPENLHGKRPGTGIPTSRLKEFWGRKAARNIDADTLIGQSDAV